MTEPVRAIRPAVGEPSSVAAAWWFCELLFRTNVDAAAVHAEPFWEALSEAVGHVFGPAAAHIPTELLEAASGRLADLLVACSTTAGALAVTVAVDTLPDDAEAYQPTQIVLSEVLASLAEARHVAR